MKILLAVLLLAGCATVNPYAYSGQMTKAECEAQCASYGYPILGVQDGNCMCNTRQCQRPRHRGGCERLPVAPNSAPSSQM